MTGPRWIPRLPQCDGASALRIGEQNTSLRVPSTRARPCEAVRTSGPASDWRLWFPEGPDDPRIAILELTVERAEYWGPKGGRLRVVYEMAKSLVKGEPAGADLPPQKQIWSPGPGDAQGDFVLTRARACSLLAAVERTPA